MRISGFILSISLIVLFVQGCSRYVEPSKIADSLVYTTVEENMINTTETEQVEESSVSSTKVESTEENLSYYDKIKNLFTDYENSMVKAINENDFSIVEKYLLKDSPLYVSQKALIKNLYGRGINEELVYSDIIDYMDFGDSILIFVHEIYNIIYTKEQKSVSREYDYCYKLSIYDSNYGVSEINIWDKSINKSYLPTLKEGQGYIYINSVYNSYEYLRSEYPIFGIGFVYNLKDKYKWNGIKIDSDMTANYRGDTYIETEEGLFMHGIQSNMYKVLKYPVVLGDEWEDCFGSAGAGGAAVDDKIIIKYKVISIDEVVETPYKTFTNVVVVQSNEGTNYFAEGYGLIKDSARVLAGISD
jgi:hypothetical protein